MQAASSFYSALAILVLDAATFCLLAALRIGERLRGHILGPQFSNAMQVRTVSAASFAGSKSLRSGGKHSLRTCRRRPAIFRKRRGCIRTAPAPLRRRVQRAFVRPRDSLHPRARQLRSPRTIHRSPDRPQRRQYPPVGRAGRWDA